MESLVAICGPSSFPHDVYMGGSEAGLGSFCKQPFQSLVTFLFFPPQGSWSGDTEFIGPYLLAGRVTVPQRRVSSFSSSPVQRLSVCPSPQLLPSWQLASWGCLCLGAFTGVPRTHLDNPGKPACLKILNLMTSARTLFCQTRSHSQVPEIRTQMSFREPFFNLPQKSYAEHRSNLRPHQRFPEAMHLSGRQALV